MVETFYIDSNEPNEMKAISKAAVKNRQKNVETQEKGLKTGDFVYQDVVIERKEASDLASSIKDGRLKEQTLRMSEDFQHQYIIVEGNPYDLEYSSLHDNSFIGTMVSRSYAGIPIIYTPDKNGTAYALNKLIEKHEDGEERTLELERTNVETEDVQVAMLTCIKGISKEKAEKMLEQYYFRDGLAGFGSEVRSEPRTVKNDLQMIDGIGPTLSQRTIDAFKK